MTYGSPIPSILIFLIISATDVLESVSSFISSSICGLDGVSPQHFKDLLGPNAREADEAL
jgi:hypothetical protein